MSVTTDDFCAGCPRRRAAGQRRVAIDEAGRRVYWQGVDAGLTLGEFRVVAALVQAGGVHLSYRAIYDVVQSPGFHGGHGRDGMRNNVRTFVKRIRRKFEQIDPGFAAIENYAGFGYAWRE